jgi:hypothetical protein
MIRLLGLLILLLIAGCASSRPKYNPQLGDVLFQSMRASRLGEMIEGATHSDFSHCGIVVQRGGEWKVLEAVGPVRETPLKQWIHQGKRDRFAAYRFKPEHQSKVPAVIAAALTMMGRPYDIQYELDDEKIYCSELIYKAYRKVTGKPLGELQTLGELNWKPYVNEIEQITGGELPLKREMITPLALAEAEELSLIKPL